MTALELRPARASGVVSDAQFHRFREYFYRRTGIAFDDAKRYYVELRLAERIGQSGLPGFAAYFQALRQPGGVQEVARLIKLFTASETCFFGDARQLAALAAYALPELGRRRPGALLRILVWPCAGGEAAYSVALYLAAHWPALAQVNLEILAGDRDAPALAAARAGRYGEAALHRLAGETRQRFFRQTGPDEFQLADEIRHAVRFAEVDASRPETLRAQGLFDVIICRNLLLFFDDATRRLAVESCYESLNPGGFICLGEAESMSRISPLFDVRAFDHALFYQKPGGRP